MTRQSRHRKEAIAEGRPELALRHEDREALAELVAELLIAAVEAEALRE